MVTRYGPLHAVAGSSANPCAENFAGTFPFSEAESRAIRDGINNVKDRLKVYINLHSYSQLVMIPYGYSKGYTTDYRSQVKRYTMASLGTDLCVWRMHFLWENRPIQRNEHDPGRLKRGLLCFQYEALEKFVTAIRKTNSAFYRHGTAGQTLCEYPLYDCSSNYFFTYTGFVSCKAIWLNRVYIVVMGGFFFLLNAPPPSSPRVSKQQSVPSKTNFDIPKFLSGSQNF